MLAEFGGFLEKIIVSTWNMLNSSSPWRCILDNHIRNVYSNLQLWNNSTWNQYVLQRGLSWTNAGIHDQHADD